MLLKIIIVNLYTLLCLIENKTMKTNKKVLLVSFDGVGATEFNSYYSENSTVKRLAQEGSCFDQVQTVFVSNTYPIHTSIATGKHPYEHGIISNTQIKKDSDNKWNYDSRKIKCKTLWEAAKEKGLKVATVLWPVTGFAKGIDYNLPEIFFDDSKKQLKENLLAGSIWFQIKSFLRHKHRFHEKMNQHPGLDDFATSVMCDVLKSAKASLMMLHLTNYDAFTHLFGKHSKESFEALKNLDNNLKRLLEYVDENTLVIVFSDHSQLNFQKTIDLNEGKSVKEGFYYHAAGSCMFIKEGLNDDQVKEEEKRVLGVEGVERLLNEQEMKLSGYDTVASFGLVAKEGYAFGHCSNEKAEHGYTLNRENYQTFVVSSKKMGVKCESVLDITKAVSHYLQLDM